MENKADFRRRLVGAIFLIASVLMIIAGETLLNVRLKQSPLLALFYWALCFVVVFLAILVAFLDLWIVRRRLREETRGLFDETLGQIAKEKKHRQPGADRPEGSQHAP